LGFSDYWTKWLFALYFGATLIMEVNGEMSAPFTLFASITQSCFLSPYLFILMIDVLSYMLKNLEAHITKWGHNLGPILCQLYLEGFNLNMERAKLVFDIFCIVACTKINWAKFDRIWVLKFIGTWIKVETTI